jgi:hypothetical protein
VRGKVRGDRGEAEREKEEIPKSVNALSCATKHGILEKG